MFFLKVEDKKRLAPAGHGGEGYREVEGEAVRVSALTGDLYGYFGYRHPNVIIGESLTPMGDSDTNCLHKRLMLRNDSRFADFRVASVVVVNVDTGKIRVFKNVNCNRPVYYHRGGGVFYCASHLRPIRAEGVSFEFDESLLPEFLVYRYIMPPNTLLKNIHALPGGWGITTLLSDSHSTRADLWQIDGGGPAEVRLEKALDTVAAHLERPLTMLNDSREKATLLLSGGLDSTILGGLCKKMGLAIDSASSGFHEITGDLGESHYAQTAADWFGFDHRIHDIGGEDYISALVDSIAVAEEPVHHLQSAVLGSMFARGIDPSVKYLVNGEGADGLFGSAVHVRYLKSRRITRFSDHRLLRALAVPLLIPLSGGNERLRYLLQDHSHDHADDAHFLWTVVSFGDIDWVRAHFGRGLGPIVEGRRKFLDHYKDWSVLDRLTLLQYTSEVDETMKIWGKLAEHSGRVMIYPFSNPDLIFALFNIGWKLKGREPKYLLRKLAARLGVPDQIINRPKRGFGFPARFWAPPGALFQPLVEMAGEMFDPRLLRSLQVEDPGRAMVLWGFLNIYLWHKTLIQNVPAVDIREEIAARRKSGERVVA